MSELTETKRGRKRGRSEAELTEVGEVAEQISSIYYELQKYLATSSTKDDDYDNRGEVKFGVDCDVKLKSELLRQIEREMVIKRKLDAMFDYAGFVKMRIRGAAFKGIDACWKPEWIAAVVEILDGMTVEPVTRYGNSGTYNGGKSDSLAHGIMLKFYGETKKQYSGFDLSDIRRRPITSVDEVYDSELTNCSNYRQLVKVASVLSVKILPVNLWCSLLMRIYYEFDVNAKQGWCGMVQIPLEDSRVYLPSQHSNDYHGKILDLAKDLDQWIAPPVTRTDLHFVHENGRVKFHSQMFLPIIATQMKIIIAILFPNRFSQNDLLKRQTAEKLIQRAYFQHYPHREADPVISNESRVTFGAWDKRLELRGNVVDGQVSELIVTYKTPILSDYSPLSYEEFVTLISWGTHCDRENTQNIEKCLKDESFPSLDDHFASFLQPNNVDNFANVDNFVETINADQLHEKFRGEFPRKFRGKLTDTNVWRAVQNHQSTLNLLLPTLDDLLPSALIQIVNLYVELAMTPYVCSMKPQTVVNLVQ